MKKYQIMERIKTATEDKKRYEPRQGAMFATETLATTLGRLFEPYITLVLPLLLTEFGDAVPDVREATQDAAKVIMSRLSGYGVKLILPTLLEGLEEKQWRTKKGSIELLGMMAYCSPRQLSLSLPIIIPRLTEVLTDSHAQVSSVLYVTCLLPSKQQSIRSVQLRIRVSRCSARSSATRRFRAWSPSS